MAVFLLRERVEQLGCPGSVSRIPTGRDAAHHLADWYRHRSEHLRHTSVNLSLNSAVSSGSVAAAPKLCLADIAYDISWLICFRSVAFRSWNM